MGFFKLFILTVLTPVSLVLACYDPIYDMILRSGIDSPLNGNLVVLVTGGWSVSSSVEVYSPDNSCNKELPDLPDSRIHHTSLYTDDRVVLCGGYYNGTTCLELSSRFPWRTHSTLTTLRYGHSSVVMGGKVRLFGGCDSLNRDVFSADYLADDDVWREGDGMAVMPGKGSCAVTVGDGTVIVTGGFNAKKIVQILHTTGGRWGRMVDMDIGRYGHGCGYIQADGMNAVLVAGGWEERTASILDLNYPGSRFQFVGTMRTPRIFGQMVVMGGTVLMMGGYSTVRFKPTDTVEKFDTARRTWTTLNNNMKKERVSHSAVAVPAALVGC